MIDSNNGRWEVFNGKIKNETTNAINHVKNPNSTIFKYFFIVILLSSSSDFLYRAPASPPPGDDGLHFEIVSKFNQVSQDTAGSGSDALQCHF